MIQINKTKNKSWLIQKEDKYLSEFEIYEQVLQNIKNVLSKIANNMLLRNNTKSACKVISQKVEFRRCQECCIKGKIYNL